MSPWVPLAAYLLTFSVGAFSSQQPVPPKPVETQLLKGEVNRANDDPKGKRGPAKPLPILVEGEITTKRAESQTAWERKDSEDKAKVDRATIEIASVSRNIAFAMFLVAAVQVGLFIWQLGLMRKTLRDTERAAQAALTQAESIKRTERARIFVSVRLDKIDRDTSEFGDIPTVTIIAVNLGKTVATICGVPAHIFASDTVPTEVPASDAAAPILAGLGVAPNAAYEYFPRYHLPTFKPESWRNSQIAWYCVGEFSYKDIYGDEQVTRFCWECKPREASGFRFCTESPLNYQT